MNKVSWRWALSAFSVWIVLGVGLSAARADPTAGLTDWSDWEKYREEIVHPATIIKPQDLVRARENIRRYGWARNYLERLRRSADVALTALSGDYLDRMIDRLAMEGGRAHPDALAAREWLRVTKVGGSRERPAQRTS